MLPIAEAQSPPELDPAEVCRAEIGIWLRIPDMNFARFIGSFDMFWKSA
jgi:hypothetical protein